MKSTSCPFILRPTLLLLAWFTVASVPAEASWEAPLASSPRLDSPQGAVPREKAPAPGRSQAVQQLYGNSGDRYSPRYGLLPVELFCQTLDSAFHPLTYATLTFTPESTFGTFGEASTLEWESASRLFAWEKFLGGHLEGAANLRLLGYLDNPGMSAIPDVAAHLAFDLAASWRFWSGWSLELRGAPGIYSDLVDPQFNCPATINLHYTFHPELAGVAGLTFRPGWDLPVFPNVGLAWQPHDVFRVEAMLPRSRVMLSPFRVLTLFGAIEWRNFDFALEEKAGAPDAFTVDEWLATAGLLIGTGEDTRISAEVGTYLSRELRADVADQATVDVSEEWLLRIGWHAAF